MKNCEKDRRISSTLPFSLIGPLVFCVFVCLLLFLRGFFVVDVVCVCVCVRVCVCACVRACVLISKFYLFDLKTVSCFFGSTDQLLTTYAKAGFLATRPNYHRIPTFSVVRHL